MTCHTHPEFFVPFGIKKGKIQKIAASSDRPGTLELQVVSGGPVFLFQGERTLEAAESLTQGTAVDFDLAAAVGQAACIRIDKGLGMVTVFASAADSIGFLRFRD